MISLLIAFFMVSLVFSFLCSLWEAALLSITPAYAEIKNQEGSAMGRHLAAFKANIDRPLAAILTLNTIAHTVGAIGVGAQASLIWGDSNPLVTGLLVPVVVTLAILLLSEIIPKTIGATYWKELAGFTVSSLRLVILILAPLVWLCQQLTKLLKRNTEGSIFSRSDFMALAEIGAREGVIEEHESTMISNLIQFESVRAGDIMTPRTVVIAAPAEMPIEAFVSSKEPPRVSRLPVYQNDSKDDITGYVLKDDLLAAMLDQRGTNSINSLRREIMIVNQDFPLPELFNRLVERKEHISLVVDEFGGMAGIVTMEDVIETLLGREIMDESDSETDTRIEARKAWETRAKAQGLVEESYSAPEVETEATDEQESTDK